MTSSLWKNKTCTQPGSLSYCQAAYLWWPLTFVSVHRAWTLSQFPAACSVTFELWCPLAGEWGALSSSGWPLQRSVRTVTSRDLWFALLLRSDCESRAACSALRSVCRGRGCTDACNVNVISNTMETPEEAQRFFLDFLHEITDVDLI